MQTGNEIQSRSVPRRGRGWLALLAMTLVGAAGASPLPSHGVFHPMPLFVYGPTPITCANTPFGLHATLAQDVENMLLFGSPAGTTISEFRPPVDAEPLPFTEVYSNNAIQGGSGPLAGASFKTAIATDLNGDGRDEVVAAYKTSSGNPILAVYERTANPAGAQLVDTWTVNQPFADIDLATGDFAATTTAVQQLAVLLRTSAGDLKAYVLEGDTSGHIGNADNSWSGLWQRSGDYNDIALTAGDMLLDGSDQIVVVADDGWGQNRVLHYHLLQFSPTTPPPAPLPVAASDTAIGSIEFTAPVDYSWGEAPDSIVKIDADAGDLVDSGAAELVVTMQYQASSYNYIYQHLMHFTTTRDYTNAVTGIDIFKHSSYEPYDDQIRIQQQNENGLPPFDVAIGNVDSDAYREVVVARATPSDTLETKAYKIAVDHAAGFTYVTTDLTANFSNTSTGDAVDYSWNFGDGSAVVHGAGPVHVYGSAGNYTVSLTVAYHGTSTTKSYSTQVTVGSGATSGGKDAVWSYHYEDNPYQDQYTLPDSSTSEVHVAVGDMDRDGTGDVLTAALDYQTLIRSRWFLDDVTDPSTFTGHHQTWAAPNQLPSNMHFDVVAADFDGDSLQGTLGSECMRVTEPQVRQVVWLPPYFAALQSGADKQASWGQSTSGTSSTETRSGSYVSHDVSGYIGVQVGTPDNLPYTIEASVAFHAGHNYQNAKGAVHGTDKTQSVDEGSQQSQGEALVNVEENSFDCYGYDVSRAAGGLEPNSAMRMCARVAQSRLLTASDAETWESTVPATGKSNLGHLPAQWFPLQRDWASLALFRAVTSSSTAFNQGAGPAMATDGLFTTAAQAAGKTSQPYLEIDLGKVRDISDIRVFPGTGGALDLAGFHVYASRTPFAGPGLPSGPGVTDYAHETPDHASYGRWNIWTRDAADPSKMLRARYIRLQHPSLATLSVAEIQIFGDEHKEPPTYPQAVCDPTPNDGYYKTLVWDAGAQQFRAIDARGDLLWSGTGAGGWPAGDGHAACSNDGGLNVASIWANKKVGGSGTLTWNMSQESGTLTGTTKSFDSSTRVGASFDFTAGFIAKVIAGAAYEFTKGITKETQNSSYWSSGLDLGGQIGGFNTLYGNLTGTCGYNPRPYAYRMHDMSNTGYAHDVYVVDYVVQEGPGLWVRADVPSICFGDVIFADGFD